MKDFEAIIADVEASIEKPLVTARFGDNWKEHTKRMIEEGQYNVDMLLDLAWKQGRRGILMERVIEHSLSPNREEGRELKWHSYREVTPKILCEIREMEISTGLISNCTYTEGAIFDEYKSTHVWQYVSPLEQSLPAPKDEQRAKELKEISREELIEVGKIIWKNWNAETDPEIETVLVYVKEFLFSDGIEYLSFDISVKIYRYLSQKGYKI